jgi:hypothetical protein
MSVAENKESTLRSKVSPVGSLLVPPPKIKKSLKVTLASDPSLMMLDSEIGPLINK